MCGEGAHQWFPYLWVPELGISLWGCVGTHVVLDCPSSGKWPGTENSHMRRMVCVRFSYVCFYLTGAESIGDRLCTGIGSVLCPLYVKWGNMIISSIHVHIVIYCDVVITCTEQRDLGPAQVKEG